MNEALPALNRRWEKVLERPVELSIGIHTGTARVGNIGSSSKFKYGPLGQTLQIGRTAQAATESLKANILVTQSTAKEVEEEFSLRRLYRFDDLDLELYELATSPTEGWEELKRRYETAWSAFESGDYPTATRLLAKILADNPNDRPSLQLLSVISEKLNDGNKLF